MKKQKPNKTVVQRNKKKKILSTVEIVQKNKDFLSCQNVLKRINKKTSKWNICS